MWLSLRSRADEGIFLTFLLVLPSFVTAQATRTIGPRSAVKGMVVNKVIHVDGITYPTIQAAIRACSSNCSMVDASDPGLGTQTFTVNPFAGVTSPFTLMLGPYTVEWDPLHVPIVLPSNVHIISRDTTFKSTRTDGLGSGGLFNTAVVTVVGSIRARTNRLSVSDASRAKVGGMVGVYGAVGGMNGTNGFGTQSAIIHESGGMRASDASVTVSTISPAASFPTSSDASSVYLLIDKEIVSYTGITPASFTGLSRGLFGTTASAHANGATIYQLALFVTQITRISGNNLILRDNATFTVTNAPVDVGTTHISFEGTATFDGGYLNRNIPVSSPVYGIYASLTSYMSVGPGYRFQHFPHVGVFLNASWRSVISGTYRFIGRPSAALGFDVLLFQQSKYNRVQTVSHENGDYVFAADDRSTAVTIYSGGASYNTVTLGPIGGAAPYIEGADIEGASNFNRIVTARLNTSSAAIDINSSGQWTADPITRGNRIDFDEVEGNGGIALTVRGKANCNLIFGGKVISGTIKAANGNYLSFLSHAAKKEIGNRGFRFCSCSKRTNRKLRRAFTE